MGTLWSHFVNILCDLIFQTPFRTALVPCLGTLDLADDFTKRRGRPRNTWAVEVRKKAQEVAGERDLADLVANEVSWKSAVKTFIKSHANPHDD